MCRLHPCAHKLLDDHCSAIHGDDGGGSADDADFGDAAVDTAKMTRFHQLQKSEHWKKLANLSKTAARSLTEAQAWGEAGSEQAHPCILQASPTKTVSFLCCT